VDLDGDDQITILTPDGFVDGAITVAPDSSNTANAPGQLNGVALAVVPGAAEPLTVDDITLLEDSTLYLLNLQ